MENITYRPATQADSNEIAELINMASEGFMDFLLHDLIPNVTPTQMLTHQIQDESSEFYFGNAIIAAQEEKILGLMHSFHASMWHKPDSELIPEDRIKHLEKFFDTPIPESLYLFTLATKSEARRQGIGSHFLTLVKDKARKMNLSKITLHVWKDNESAIHLYEKAGFTIINTLDIARHELLPHDGGMLLMSCDI